MALEHLLTVSELVKKYDHEADPIMLCKQSQHLANFIRENFQIDEEILALFKYLNTLALDSEDMAANLGHLLTSRAVIGLRFKKSHTIVRNEVLRVLESNFASHQAFKEEHPQKAYNSMSFLGEFYNLLRIDGLAIHILGKSLLKLIDDELQDILDKKTPLTPEFGKLVLTQIVLNGPRLRTADVARLNTTLDLIRRTIMEVEARFIRGKAYLMMALDLYLSNFTEKAMLSLQKLYQVYQDQTAPQVDHFAETDMPEPKRQRVEIAVQTEVAISDVFRDGPVIVAPVERASISTVATTCTNVSVSREDSPRLVPTSPSATNSSGTQKSKIDPRIRNVKIGRIYPSPVSNGSGRAVSSVSTAATLNTTATTDGPEVGKLSIKNVTLHELACMKENPSHLNRITNGYLDRLGSPSEMMCPSIKSGSEYMGKENDQQSEQQQAESVKGMKTTPPPATTNGIGHNSGKRPATTNCGRISNKFQMEENIDTITFDASHFDDYVPHEHVISKTKFLQFLENK